MKKHRKILTMWKILLFFVLLTLLFNSGTPENDYSRRQQFENHLSSLFQAIPQRTDVEKDHLQTDEPEMAAWHEFMTTFDPATGKVPRERLYTACREMEKYQADANPVIWENYPANMGGRTRAIMYDPNDPSGKKVWAGGVTGGLWYNTDITSPVNPWIPVNDFWPCLAIRCLTFDPQNHSTFYAGTGEAETAMQTYRESSGLGYGIMKSTDGGLTWNQIPGTDQFAYITDIVVRIENNASVLYVGVASGLYEGAQHQSLPTDGLFRSSDQGMTWQQVLPLIPGENVPYCVSDIALGSDNRLYAGTRPNLNGKGAAVILYSDNGVQWTVNTQYQSEILASSTNNIPGRVVLATAPSDPLVVYALIASGYINPANNFQYFNCYHVLRSGDRGATWVKKSIPPASSGNNFATIAWHALDVAVDPNVPDWLYVGGLDMYKSFNGGISWIKVSDWSKMYSGGGTDYIHADQHIIVYKPGSSDEILFGSDGGVFYTNDGSGTIPEFMERNTGYNTLQVYTCALHPQAGFNQFYGGLQDNGSLFNVGLGEPLTINNMVSGGDGAYCFYDIQDPALSITSVYYNSYVVFDNGTYINSLGNWSSGTFVSPADLDYKNKILYCNAVDYIGTHADQILRINNLTWNATGTYLTMGTGSQIPFSAVRYSPFSPPGTTTVFAATASGRLFRAANMQTNQPGVTEIGSASFPVANISSVALGKSEDTLLTTFSNYGVASVWLTTNGGNNWSNVEGNLPDIPVRWALFHPQSSRRAIIATETGVWECLNLFSQPVVWVPLNTGMGNVRVDMLQVRTSDNTVLAATHGRGFFSMIWDLNTGKEEANTIKAIVAPNPSDRIFNLQFPYRDQERLTLVVFSLSGHEVIRENFVPGALTHKEIDLSGNAPGLYYYSVISGEKSLCSGKLVLK